MTFQLQVVDLTRTLDETTSLWPGIPPLMVESVETIAVDGSFSRRVTLDEHSGTHFDAPSHFRDGAAHVADVPADKLVGPLHIIDFTDQSSEDPDAELNVADIERHEAVNGVVVAGAVVFLRTDWDHQREDELMRFPGFGVDSARLLVQRGVIGLGTDTLSVDPGRAAGSPVHRNVTLPSGVWHVENLTNLASVPSSGAWAVVGVPKVGGASGFPVRVFAIIPER